MVNESRPEKLYEIETPPTVAELFHRASIRWKRRVAVGDDRGHLTYGQVAKLASAIARRLERVPPMEPLPGERVGLMIPTIKEFPAAYYAVLMVGRTPVPLNYLLDSEELLMIIEDAGITTVIATRHFSRLLEGLVPRIIYLEDLSLLGVLLTPTMAPVPDQDPDGVATLLYTRGTTGRPKGVELTNRNLTSNVAACLPAAQVRETDVVLGALPFFHSFALTVTMNLVFTVGVRAYYIPRFNARQVLGLLRTEKITLVPLVPSMYRMLCRSAGKGASLQEHSLRVVIAGGEPLPREVAEEFESVFGIPLLEGYGLTETAPVLCINRPDRNRPGTVGEPLENVEIRIIDEAGRELPAGQDGEIVARSPCVMRGYRNQVAETAAVLKEGGWFHTGDMGRLDEDGFLRITGRKKELIISSGENIYPREIEDALTTHPAVYEAAVIGVPDRARGEVPHAFISCTEGDSVSPEALREHLRGLIADYKVPRVIEVREELPHAPTGKILKRALEPEAPSG